MAAECGQLLALAQEMLCCEYGNEVILTHMTWLNIESREADGSFWWLLKLVQIYDWVCLVAGIQAAMMLYISNLLS